MSDCFDHMGDAYDDLLSGRTADEGYRPYRAYSGGERVGRTCKFCSMPNLFWHQSNGRWVLCKAGTGVAHECIVKAKPRLEA